MGKAKRTHRRIEYVAPTDEAIDAFARSVCEQLAEDGDRACATLEVVRGLTEFMKLAGRIQAKHLNRTQAVDNDHKSEYS